MTQAAEGLITPTATFMESQDLRISGSQDLRISGFQDLRI
jgi:hypothetical protein